MEHDESPWMNLSLSNMNYSEDYFDYNSTNYLNEYQNTPVYIKHISAVKLIICCIGLPLNGIVIWLLSFQIKRNPFTVLILNLAISDFGFLLCMAISCIHCFTYFIPRVIQWIIFFSISCTMHINGLFLLTAISINRCVSVLFPECHRCPWPKYFTPVGCAYLWICSFLLGGIFYINPYVLPYSAIWTFYLVVIAVLCLPLTTISTVILFIKICLKPKQMIHGRLLVMILITLLCFLILTLPLYIYMFTVHFLGMKNILTDFPFGFYFYLSACLNSSIKPGIYFVVGTRKRARTRESIKVIFQRVFREDEAPETG